jgi:cytochrome b involved in lipid metabolism
MGGDSALKKLSLKEVENHTDKKSCWIIIHDKVYDVTKFLEEVSLLMNCIVEEVLLL